MIQKPFDISIRGTTIDAKKNNTIRWRVTGAIPVAFSIVIRKNSDNSIAFSIPKTNSFNSEYELLNGSLQNGIEYKITVTVWDEKNSTASSDAEIFQTSSTPVVTVSPIGTIGTSSYQFTANYTQLESVQMRSWVAILYDRNRTVKQRSDLQTSSDIQYLFEDLQVEQNYFVEFLATSDKGLIGTSGLIPFEVYYARPNTSLNLQAENWEEASVRLQWYVSQIIGKSSDSSFINNEKINAQNGKVWFDEGFSINKNFTIKMWFEGATNVNVSDKTEFIKSDTPPSNINAIWMPSSTVGSNPVNFVASKTPPTSLDSVWIKDDGYANEKIFNIVIDGTSPINEESFWLNRSDVKDNLYLLKLTGENGYLSLNYYNNKFHLHKNEDGTTKVVDSISVSGNSFYIYIQQIGDIYKLFAQNH